MLKKLLILVNLHLLQVYIKIQKKILKMVWFFRIKNFKKKLICVLGFIETLLIYSKSFYVSYLVLFICATISLLYLWETISFKLKLNRTTILCLLFILKYLMLVNPNPASGLTEIFLIFFIFRLIVNLNEQIFKK